MALVVLSCLTLAFIASPCLCQADPMTLVFDDSAGLGRRFDGIGGLSGGGATSKLLVNYPVVQRDQILDYLFKPGFGASLQILKVEIGGDAQSTDGTEASHMHYSWEENYQRGYEWWLMKEAKKRNPDIKLYALPWGFPGWIGQGTQRPYTNDNITADYIVRWINGSSYVHGLHIDYVGIWNERLWNAPYVKTLRATLDARGFKNVAIVAADGGWDPAEYIMKGQDPDFAPTIYAVGAHYPGTYANPAAKSCGKKLWSSEDYSTKNDEIGAGCWARILNQNYVNGLMTATISWNLIASYYPNLPFFRCGLMTAVEPWSGNYTVSPPIWISAHTTQFTKIGWYYLQHGFGVGRLPKGGSYVSLVSPDSSKGFTIVFETMSHDHSGCVRPDTPSYTVEPQTVTLQLKGAFATINKMNVWKTKLGFNGSPDSMFIRQNNLTFTNGQAQLSLGVDEVITLTTVDAGSKGQFSTNATSISQPFPLPYTDDFQGYDFHQEPFNLAQQMGSFEIAANGTSWFVRQMMIEGPVQWCQADGVNKTLNLIGGNWTNIFIEVDINLSAVNGSTGAYVAARVDRGGCHADQALGIFFFALPHKYIVSNNINQTKVLTQGDLSFQPGEWHKLSLFVQNGFAQGSFDGKVIFNITTPQTPTAGFAAIGTDSYGLADFDNLKLDSKPS